MSPTIKQVNQATAANALNGLKFATLMGPALVSAWFAGVTAGDTVSLSVGQKDVLNLGEPNIEISADVLDVSRDQVVFAEPGGQGDELFMPVTVTTAMNFMVLIDEI